MKKIFAVILFLAFFSSPFEAQTCGFGCLGLAGFYGGYAGQKFEADGLNNYLADIYPNEDIKFDQVRGIRVGANIFRAQYTSVFFSAKGFYQFFRQTRNLDFPGGVIFDKNELTLTMDNFGFALDFGFRLFRLLDFKLVEAGANFYTIKFTDKKTLNLADVSEKTYKTDKIQIGYFAGSGLIINIIPDYMSIEGTVFYSYLQVDGFAEVNPWGIGNADDKLISKGGLGAYVQLNLGIPL